MSQTYKGIAIPENDQERIKAVDAYGILDTPPEQEYDDVTVLAAQITGCPISYISIFDKTRSWLKSSYGLPPNRPPRPREQSMCAPTICQREMMVIPDLRQNPRYASLPAVVNPPHARFYCGVPLINRDVYALGTLCVWSPEETNLDEDQFESMKRLAQMTMAALERRRDILEMKSTWEDTQRQLDRSRDAIARAEQVAYRLLPQATAARLLSNADVPARVYEDVTIVCLRLVGLDGSSALPVLESLVPAFDSALVDCGLERIGLLGEAFFGVAGLRAPRKQSSDDATRALSEMVALTEKASADAGGASWRYGAGLASGSLLVSLTGQERIGLSYWGSAVFEAYHKARVV